MALTAIFVCAGAVLADGNAFTPLDFNDTQYSSQSTTYTQAPMAKGVVETEAVGNPSMQNAILQLDNAQVDIRTELMNSKTRYAEVDAQYKVIKAERKALKKQVRTVEKRINNIEKTKEKIRKNM